MAQVVAGVGDPDLDPGVIHHAEIGRPERPRRLDDLGDEFDDDDAFDLTAGLDASDPQTLLASARTKASGVRLFAQGGVASTVDGLRADLLAGVSKEERELGKEKIIADFAKDAELAITPAQVEFLRAQAEKDIKGL